MKLGVCTTVRSAGVVGSGLGAVLLENGMPKGNRNGCRVPIHSDLRERKSFLEELCQIRMDLPKQLMTNRTVYTGKIHLCVVFPSQV